MPGVKLGDRLLVGGATDPKMVAGLAVKTGLTGRACLIDDSSERITKAAMAVRTEGALIETITAPLTSLPLETESFDLVVLRDVVMAASGDALPAIAREAARVLRPGGRCIAIDSVRRGGLSRLFGAQMRAGGGAAGTMQAFQQAGFRGVRTLAEQEGLVFVEGIKPAG